ncbi:MAG TPA: outer membrane beta-barrel protein, partial [Terriglobales bacterium]|nr:outer membrane beta-barrel protein [Terriglobales bacterium]
MKISFLLLAATVVLLAPTIAFGQGSASVAQGASSAALSSDSATPRLSRAEMLEELDRMRLRIQQLEDQLRAEPAETAAVPAVATASATSPAAGKTNPVAAQEPSKPEKAAPFAFADWSWLNGNPRTKKAAFDSEFFTPEIRADVNYTYSFNRPSDDTIGGSSEVFRSGEFQLEQLGVGGDFHYDNVQARVMTQFGMYSATTPRNDASPARGNWDLDTAYRYIAEGYGGYHFNALHGINAQAGIFMSYVGLFSYY